MNDADHFSWLHLTDFHYGLNGQDCLWPNLRAPFLDDLEKLHGCCGPWQAVLFTGDLVQSGDPSQFGEMQREVLDRIWGKLAQLGSGDAVLLAVPGNHDLRRPEKKSDNAARDTLLRIGGFSDVPTDRFWNDPDSGYRRVVSDAFASYENWWRTAKQSPKSGITAGLLPGDFAYTLQRGNRRIGLIGLNTTFLQLDGGNYRARLVWDARQIQHVSGGAIDDWLNHHDVSLLLTHQGPDWLTPERREHGDTEIAPAGRFALHLFGHMHETSIVYVSTGGGLPLRRCQSRSVFGMEKFGEPPSEQRSHGYISGRIEFGEKEATLRLWPRTATKGTGPWRFIADQEKADLREDEGTNPENITVRSITGSNLTVDAKGARSDFIKIPAATWPEELTKKGIPMPDSMLLRPESRIVRFHHLREQLRDTIIDWANEKSALIRLRLQAGEGGAGKTRLMIEVCDQLERSHGWRAGFLDRAQSIASGLPALLKEGKPTLIVLDYAETRAGEIVEITRTALYAINAPPICLALLARDGGDWWDHLADAAGNDQAVAGILRGHLSKTGPYRMNTERIEEEHRVAIFSEALHAFAGYKNLKPPSIVNVDLSDDLFGNPFFVHLAALAYLRGAPSFDDKELLGLALGHERSYWRQLLEAKGLADFQPAFEQAVALFTLCGAQRTAKDARALFSRTPSLRNVERSVSMRLFDALRRMYPLEGGLRGLQPDVLGETLVSQALAKEDELLDAAFGEGSEDEIIRHSLTVLTRLSRRVPKEQYWLREALRRNLIRISEHAMHVGLQTGSPLPEVHAEIVRTAPDHDRRRAVETLRTKLPTATNNLGALNVEIRRQFAAFLNEKKSGSPAKRHIASFEAFSSLAIALRGEGLLSEAAHASVEAVRHAQEVFRSADVRDRHRLSVAFNDHGIHLSAIGRFEDALKAAEKSEALLRALAEKQPVAYTADWAASLNTLGNRLSEVGRFEDALKAAEKSEGLRRGLVEKQPDTHTAAWATSLGNLGIRLSKVGRFEDALKATEKSEELERALAAKQPDIHTAAWATSLRNLGIRLSELGRFEDALKAAQRSEELARVLAEKQPDAYTADWAGSLINLGARLSDIGRFDDAVKAVEKSEELERELAEKQPDAYTAAWAGSLGNLANRLSGIGRFEDALKAAEKSEELERVLAEKQPDAYTADWAATLDILGNRLSEVGRFEDALKAAEKSEALLRAPAEKQPDAYTAAWAGSLSNLGVRLSEVGRFEDALKAAEKSERLKRVLAEKQSDAYRSDWATSLCNLANSKFETGDFAGAVESANAAILVLADQAEKYPTQYLAWIGFARRVIADSNLEMKQAESALSEGVRSVEIWERVAAVRQTFESKQVAKAFLVLMRSQLALKKSREVIKTFEYGLDILKVALSINPRPLKSTLEEMLALVRDVDSESAARIASGRLRHALQS